MAFYPVLYINKSGKKITIIDSSNGLKVGDIANREAYIHHGSEGNMHSIEFLGPNGRLVGATINSYSLSIPDSFFASCTAYHSNYYTIEGKNYHIFDMRRKENVYMADGTKWGTVAAGARVACSDDTCGQTHGDWKQVEYISSGNNWIKVSGHGSDYGFVDTGLSKGSAPTTISMYGSW